MLESIQNAALEVDYEKLELSFRHTNVGPELPRFLERRVEGMMMLPTTTLASDNAGVLLCGTQPFGSCWGGSTRLGIDMALRPDDTGRMAMMRLYQKGRRQIACAGPSSDFFSQARLSGVIDATHKLRISKSMVSDVSHIRELYHIAEWCGGGGAMPTRMFCPAKHVSVLL